MALPALAQAAALRAAKIKEQAFKNLTSKAGEEENSSLTEKAKKLAEKEAKRRLLNLLNGLTGLTIVGFVITLTIWNWQAWLTIMNKEGKIIPAFKDDAWKIAKVTGVFIIDLLVLLLFLLIFSGLVIILGILSGKLGLIDAVKIFGSVVWEQLKNIF